MKVRDLLKKATKLKKENKIEEAIKILEEAYKKGVYEPSSHIISVDDNIDLDLVLSLQDIVRKAKYLQELGKINEALEYLDELIVNTSKRANYSIWEIHDLSSLYNHRAIILKKEKRFDEEFTDRIKSYCLRGIAVNINAHNKPKKTGDDFIDKLELKNFNRNRKDLLFELMNILDVKRLLKFVEDNSKKTNLKFDKREIVSFVQLVISQNYKNDKIGIEFKKLIK